MVTKACVWHGAQYEFRSAPIDCMCLFVFVCVCVCVSCVLNFLSFTFFVCFSFVFYVIPVLYYLISAPSCKKKKIYIS